MLELTELLNKDDPVWHLVKSWIDDAKNSVEVLPARDPDRANALVATQVTTRSTMGAIIYETGGLLIDSGWIRILGSGHPRLPRSLPGWSTDRAALSDYFLVGDDVLGGLFAINGGGLGKNQGNIFYFAPDSLEWEDMGRGYSEFIQWCFSGDLETFYSGLRWLHWKDDLRSLGGHEAYSIYPPLWSKESSSQECSRKAIPLAEIYNLYFA